MRNDKIVILHVFSDAIIFSRVADNYDSVDGVENLYYFYSREKSFKFQSIRDSRVKTIHDFDKYAKMFSDPEIDVILFHALPYYYYYLFNFIDESKFVIWWAWGFDIYYGQGKYPPLIPLDEMYKPLTLQYIRNHQSSFTKLFKLAKRILLLPKSVLARLNSWIYDVKPLKTQEQILSRIDSFYSPLDVEYEFMYQYHDAFTAKRIPIVRRFTDVPFRVLSCPRNILVNHSLTYTDNHLDVFDRLKNIIIEDGRKYIIPVSYGIDGFDGKPDNLIKVSCLDENHTMWLTKVLPLKDYEKVLSTVSHAVFGALRQQALGNIYKCLTSGVKVFMYEDSILYKELKKQGYVLYTIDNDLSTDSLALCLSEEDARINHDIYVQYLNRSTPESCRNYLESAIKEKKHNSNLNNRI